MCRPSLSSEKRRFCGVCIWFELQKGPIVMLKILCCPHLTYARPFSWDADRPDRGRQIVRAYVCMWAALHYVHASVCADILTLLLLIQQQ